MSKVYIPNLPTRHDALNASRVPTVNLNPAAAFGDLTKLTEGPVQARDLSARLDTLSEASADFDPEEDYIICVGDILLVAAFIHYAQVQTGAAELRILQWDRENREYNVSELSL